MTPPVFYGKCFASYLLALLALPLLNAIPATAIHPLFFWIRSECCFAFPHITKPTLEWRAFIHLALYAFQATPFFFPAPLGRAKILLKVREATNATLSLWHVLFFYFLPIY